VKSLIADANMVDRRSPRCPRRSRARGSFPDTRGIWASGSVRLLAGQ
jgi:hypothetical protein